MSQLRDHLAEQLARKIQAHGLVVWEDDDGEYRNVSSAVVPEGVHFEAFSGSWYELRRRIEDSISTEQPPALVVYVPAAPADDPLAEVRAAAAEFKRKLATLVRQALAGQLTERRIAEIAKKATTLVEAEDAIAGDSDADVRLISLLGSSDTVKMLVTVLTGEPDAAITAAAAWEAVGELCSDVVGATCSGESDDFRDALFRHVLLCDVDRALDGGLPESVSSTWQRPDATRQRRAADVLERLVHGHVATCKNLAGRADTALALADSLPWSAGLETVVGTPAVDTVSFRAAIRMRK